REWRITTDRCLAVYSLISARQVMEVWGGARVDDRKTAGSRRGEVAVGSLRVVQRQHVRNDGGGDLLDLGVVLTRQQAAVERFANLGPPGNVEVVKRPCIDPGPVMHWHVCLLK